MKISNLINSLMIMLTLAAFLIQFLIDFSTVNIACSIIIFCSGLSTILYLRWTNALESHPLSSFAILGLSITTLTGAIWVQSLSWVAVSASLRQPIVTFSWLAFYSALSIIAHSIYRLKASPSKIYKPNFLRRLFDDWGIYDYQSVSVIWIIGVFGLICILFSKVLPVANGFSYLAWMPFLIPLIHMKIGKDFCNLKYHMFFLVLHTLVIVLLAMFFNSRGQLLFGFATVFLLLFLNLLRSHALVSVGHLYRAGLIIVVLFSLSIPASNLATAMVMARDERSLVSPIKTIESTINYFVDQGKIDNYRYRKLYEKNRFDYDETYITNPLLARLVTTKFHDNTIYFAEKISDLDADAVQGISFEFLWLALPTPVLEWLQPNIQKSNYLFSSGDLLAHYAIGTSLSGYKTGSIFAQGMLIFGLLFPIIYFGFLFVLFSVIDIFAKRSSSGFSELSIIGMLNIWPNFLFGLTNDSLHSMFIGVFRGAFQATFLFLIAVFFAKLIAKTFNVTSRAKSS